MEFFIYTIFFLCCFVAILYNCQGKIWVLGIVVDFNSSLNFYQRTDFPNQRVASNLIGTGARIKAKLIGVYLICLIGNRCLISDGFFLPTSTRKRRPYDFPDLCLMVETENVDDITIKLAYNRHKYVGRSIPVWCLSVIK